MRKLLAVILAIRDRLDNLLVAATYAEAGEPDLARRILDDPESVEPPAADRPRKARGRSRAEPALTGERR
jgi:hypothetical protein